MSRFNIKLNGWDASHAFNKWGVAYQPIRVNGPNGGISMGGSTIVDLVKTKDLLVLAGNAVREADYRKICALVRLDYVTAIFEHPETGASVTRVMIPELSAANRTPLRDGETWYEGWTLTLEER